MVLDKNSASMDLIQFPVLSPAGNGEICEQGVEIWETMNESEIFSVQTADCIVFHPY